MITVYTDGACKNNPGVGGYAAVMLFDNPEIGIKIIAGGEPHTTNSRMELMGVLKALSWIYSNYPLEKIHIYTDSQYVTNAINKGWLEKWIERDFRNIKNKDLWLLMYKYVCRINPTFTWVRGHNGNMYNEIADKIASDATFFQGVPMDYKPAKVKLAA